ncbi:helix-turn-helix domain-containing protein [Rhodococcus hoagii]|nr:helix-turn-helix domain-containing protein [Prescottella equi]
MKNPHTSRSTTVARTTLLDRIGTVLDAFGSNSPLTGCDIMDSTRLPRTSTYRILEQLVAIGWLEREGNTHRLGTRLVELGSLALDQDPLAQAAEPHLLRLHRRTGLVVHLAVLDGTDVVYLRKVGDTLDRLSPTRTGLRVPAAGSVLGEALLGWADAGPTTLSRQHRRSMAVTANWHTSSPGSLPRWHDGRSVRLYPVPPLPPRHTGPRRSPGNGRSDTPRPAPPGPATQRPAAARAGREFGRRRPVHPLNTCPSHRRAAGRIMRINSRVTGAYMQTEER